MLMNCGSVTWDGRRKLPGLLFSDMGGIDIEVGGMQELQEKILDIFADVTGFGQCCGIADRKWHLQELGQSPGHQRLATPGRADHQNVRLLNLNLFLALGLSSW